MIVGFVYLLSFPSFDFELTQHRQSARREQATESRANGMNESKNERERERRTEREQRAIWVEEEKGRKMHDRKGIFLNCFFSPPFSVLRFLLLFHLIFNRLYEEEM